ncbi:uncharacterized protein LOC129894370 [Solanum dulcamara]|uniref:uncharacterized protein LOC129894370 n=1 Tax=Solanum dulcamara TaxID=45834 RepID=UPI0024855A4C|nr:uncharacterized protein LOC129894370 [Solanum dulcamara]
MNIPILLRHSRVWQSKMSYERCKIDGIVVGDNISFVNLKSAIAAELTIDESVKNIEIRYIVQGQLYKDKATLVAVMAKYKIDNGFNFKVKRFDSKRYVHFYVLICYLDDCCWRMKASCRKNSVIFKVRYFNSEHSCLLRDRIFNKVHATKSFVSAFTAPKLVNHKRIHTANDIREDIKTVYGVDITYQQAWRAKEHALEMLRRKPADEYRQLRVYIHMLKIVYPNSYISMDKSPIDEFMYLFIALRPLMRDFQFCRPVVVVDGAHFDGPYKGTFVLASTLDGAGCILPLAYGVVDTKNNSSWTWFFQHFKDAFGERDNMCIISDRNESIMKSVVASSEYLYSVYESGRRYIVCIERKTCNCGRFQLDEIPCPHAIAVLKSKNIADMHPYCSDYYKLEALANTYELPMVSMPDKKDWEGLLLLLPDDES